MIDAFLRERNANIIWSMNVYLIFEFRRIRDWNVTKIWTVSCLFRVQQKIWLVIESQENLKKFVIEKEIWSSSNRSIVDYLTISIFAYKIDALRDTSLITWSWHSDDFIDLVLIWCIIYVYSRSTNVHRRLFFFRSRAALFKLVITI